MAGDGRAVRAAHRTEIHSSRRHPARSHGGSREEATGGEAVCWVGVGPNDVWWAGGPGSGAAGRGEAITFALREPSRARAMPSAAMPIATIRMAKVPSTLLSAEDWHSPTKAIQSARSVALVVAGSAPAPIDPGSKNATIADSDEVPGPHVPPTAGLGRPTSSPAIAKATPKSPTNTKANRNPM